MMKKIIAVTALFLMLLTLTACSDKKDYAFSVDGEVISTGVYTYYLDKVRSSPESFGAKADDTESIKAAAKSCCLEYIAAIRLMSTEGMTLQNDLKREAAESTENIWSLFSSYYESIGVTKQDITKVQTHECRKTQLLDFYYGEKGKSPVSDDDMKEEFVDMYVGFKAIEGSLTRTNDKGEVINLTDKEISEIEDVFSDMASQINSGTATIDQLNEEYNDSQGIIVTSALTTELMKEGDPMYDDDFFSVVMGITHGKAKVIKSGTSIYVIERQKIATTDEDAFMMYRQEVLHSMRMPKIEKKIENAAKKLTCEVNEKAVQKIEKKVLTVKD